MMPAFHTSSLGPCPPLSSISRPMRLPAEQLRYSSPEKPPIGVALREEGHADRAAHDCTVYSAEGYRPLFRFHPTPPFTFTIGSCWLCTLSMFGRPVSRQFEKSFHVMPLCARTP